MNQIVQDASVPLLPPPAATPVVTRQRFAELVGVTLDVVNKWCDRGYLPTVPLGRWSLINLALVNERCLDKEFKSLDTNIVSLRAHHTDATARSA